MQHHSSGSVWMKDSSLSNEIQLQRVAWMSLANSPESWWAVLIVSFASCTASSSLAFPTSGLAALIPQKMPLQNCWSSLVFLSTSLQRISRAFITMACMYLSANSSSLAMQSSFLPRHTYRTGLPPSASSSPSSSRCLLNPANRSCLRKESGVRRNLSLRLLAKAAKSMMASMCVRTLQVLLVFSQRRARVAMSSGEGRLLVRLRGGGGSFEKL